MCIKSQILPSSFLPRFSVLLCDPRIRAYGAMLSPHSFTPSNLKHGGDPPPNLTLIPQGLLLPLSACSGDVTLAAVGLEAESRGKARADPIKKYGGQRGGVKVLLCAVYMPAYERVFSTVLRQSFEAAVHGICGCKLTFTCGSRAADPL